MQVKSEKKYTLVLNEREAKALAYLVERVTGTSMTEEEEEFVREFEAACEMGNLP